MKTYLISLFSLLTVALQAQVSLNYGFSTDTMLVGDQLLMKLELKGKASEAVIWPLITDTLGDFEVVEQSSIDTIPSDTLNLEKYLFLTQFDTGVFVVPSLAFSVNQDSIFTQSHQLVVLPVHIDSTNAGFYAQVDPLEVPYVFGEFKDLIINILIGILILGLLAFFIIRYLKKQQKKEKVELKIPAHILALGELSELKSKHYIDSDEIKTYYSELSDIIRRYIERRYHFLALESTTSEIAQSLKTQKLTETQKTKLMTFLEEADLVKFAKAFPEAHQHEVYYSELEEFIHQTKVQFEEIAVDEHHE
ncbi:MAG: hypothetical protein ACPG4W_00130 [Flavobacteriales bacterium]